MVNEIVHSVFHAHTIEVIKLHSRYTYTAGISRLCSKIAGGEIPLSVVTTQGYMGYNRKLIVQASKFHHS